MPGAKIFLDKNRYPQVEKLVNGQRVSITISGPIEKTNGDAMLTIETLDIGKKQRLNTQQILMSQMNERLKRIEAKSPGVAARP